MNGTSRYLRDRHPRVSWGHLPLVFAHPALAKDRPGRRRLAPLDSSSRMEVSGKIPARKNAGPGGARPDRARYRDGAAAAGKGYCGKGRCAGCPMREECPAVDAGARSRLGKSSFRRQNHMPLPIYFTVPPASSANR